MNILLDVHTHSIASGHGTVDTITTMAKQAAKNGLKLLGITDHGPATIGSGTVSYFRGLSQAPRQRFGVELLYGAELNILDQQGSLDLDNDILSTLDFAIASMHLPNKAPGTLVENTQAYIQAMKNPYVKIIGHCDDSRYLVDYRALVEAAHASHVLLEINNASLSPAGYRGDTLANNQQILRHCMEQNHPILLSSDSHGSKDIGDVTHAAALAASMNFPKDLILNYDVDQCKEYLL